MTTRERMEAKMAESHDKALAHFTGQIAEMREKLADLAEYADDHMGFDPDEIGWGHVGTAAHFLENLTELTDCAYKRGEYAE